MESSVKTLIANIDNTKFIDILNVDRDKLNK